jgi:hypothetical protein
VTLRYRFAMRIARLRPAYFPFVIVLLGAVELAAPLPVLAQAAVRRTPVVEVVDRVSPAVVNVSAESMVRDVDPFFGGLLSPSRRRKTQSLGSGLIIDANGIVVTNAHVIEGASRIVVTTLDGRELDADVLGSDRDAELDTVAECHRPPGLGDPRPSGTRPCSDRGSAPTLPLGRGVSPTFVVRPPDLQLRRPGTLRAS